MHIAAGIVIQNCHFWVYFSDSPYKKDITSEYDFCKTGKLRIYKKKPVYKHR